MTWTRLPAALLPALLATPFLLAVLSEPPTVEYGGQGIARQPAAPQADPYQVAALEGLHACQPQADWDPAAIPQGAVQTQGEAVAYRPLDEALAMADRGWWTVALCAA